MYAYEYLVRT